MKLITDEDVPTPRLTKLAASEGDERKALLLDLFRTSYGFLDGKVDLKNTTPVKLREALVEQGAQGDTLDKIYAFMIAMAKDAGVELSTLLLKRLPGARRPRPRPTTRQPQTRVEAPEGDEEEDDSHGAAMKTVALPKSGGTITLSGNINLFELVGSERDLVFALIDTMRKFEEAQEGGEG